MFICLADGFCLCLNLGHSHPQELFIFPPDIVLLVFSIFSTISLKSGFLCFLRIQSTEV